MEDVIKYILIPSYLESEWVARNPLLLRGEGGHVMSVEGVIIRSKVGPGLWNNLPWYPDVYFDRNETITNPIGDAKGNLNNNTLMTVVEKMLFPFSVPAISNLKNNAQGGSPQNIAIREIGLALSGVVNVTYTISNPTNLLGATPINITSGGIFSNDGNFANLGSLDMNLTAPLNPNVVTEYPILVKPIHIQGEGVTVTTKIVYHPKLIWGVSPLTTLTGAQFNSIGQKQTIISNIYKRDYTFTAAGYPWVGIPVMLGPTNLIFSDVTDPNAPAGFSFEDMGVLSVNNGVATYNYQMFRGSYYLTQNLSKLRIA